LKVNCRGTGRKRKNLCLWPLGLVQIVKKVCVVKREKRLSYARTVHFQTTELWVRKIEIQGYRQK